MKNNIIYNLDRLLEISERKSRLLQSIKDQFEHIESNPVFIEEVYDAYNELDADESALIGDIEITIECPSCGFECNQIHSFCLACGAKLPQQYKQHNPLDA